MEHIGEILKRQTQINTSRENTETGSSAEKPSGTVCPICQGAGFVHPRLPSGKPDYSRVVNCQCVRQELDKERHIYLRKYSNLGALTRFTFDNLNPRGKSDHLARQEMFQRAYEASKAFATEPKGWLVLSGPPGSGKTHLATAIANFRISQGEKVFFINTTDLLDHLRATFSPGSDVTYDQLFDQVRNVPLLILDDLGVQSSTPWAQEKLDQLLNHRYSHELPTVIVIARPMEDLDERIRARLTDSRLCQVYILDEAVPSPMEYSWGPGFELQKNMTFENFVYYFRSLTTTQLDTLKEINESLTKERKPVKSEAGYLEELNQNLKSAHNLAFVFAKDPEGWLVFMGVTGCGKTHLAAAIANYRYKQGKPALFVVVPDFLDHLRSTFNPDSKISFDKLFESVKTTPLLIMDDFGAQSTTPWAREKLYQVINYRYNARLATVITTTYSLEEIFRNIEGSISSRLVDPKISTPFNIISPDFRGDVRHSSKPSQRSKRDSESTKPRYPQPKREN